MRLACVKHAASVRSEPGSNSQVHLSPDSPPENHYPRHRCRSINEQTRTHGLVPIHQMTVTTHEPEQPSKRTVTHQRRYAPERPQSQTNEIRVYSNPDHRSGRSISPVLAHEDPRAPPTYPFLAYATVKDRSKNTHRPRKNGPNRLTCSDVRQLGAEQRTLAQPHQEGKRQIAPSGAAGAAM